MYQRILAALDGSSPSDMAAGAALALCEKSPGSALIGSHVYAAELHRARFEEMEAGLPEQYQAEERLDHLRRTHDSLITDGLQLISDAYLAPLARAAEERNVACQGWTPEGRNYAELLRGIEAHEIDLAVLGAWGQGRTAESQIGSVTERVLLGSSRADTLIVRRPWGFKGMPIVVGIDGSPHGYAALLRAIDIAKAFDARLEAVAVYDPFFHLGVFHIIAGALPDEERQRFDFPAQEKLHDEIIDRGLEQLYGEGLERAVLLARKHGIELHTEVLAGKVYPQIHHYAGVRNASLIVVGRWGLHRDSVSLIGSNTLNLARLTTANLLVVAPPHSAPDVPALPRKEAMPSRLSWAEGGRSAHEARSLLRPGHGSQRHRRTRPGAGIDGHHGRVRGTGFAEPGHGTEEARELVQRFVATQHREEKEMAQLMRILLTALATMSCAVACKATPAEHFVVEIGTPDAEAEYVCGLIQHYDYFRERG